MEAKKKDSYTRPRDKERVERLRERIKQAADGVALYATRKRPRRSDDDFISSLVERLHGVAIALESRDLATIAMRSEIEEARELSGRINQILSRAQKRKERDETDSEKGKQAASAKASRHIDAASDTGDNAVHPAT